MDPKIKGTIEQLEVLSSKDILKRVISCAGSGKTWVLTGSIINALKNRSCSPAEVLALTFTNNAAENMRVRIRDSIKRKIEFENINIFTFNSFGHELIKENSFKLGLGKDFKLINSSQSWQVLYEIFKEISFEHLKVGKDIGRFVQGLLAYIENLKNNLISVPQLDRYLSDHKNILSAYRSRALGREEEKMILPQRELFGIYQEYEKRKFAANCIDYADQVFLPYFLLLEKKSLRIKYQQRYKYIYVDEFQDTNMAQAFLLSLIFDHKSNKLMVVGDDDQGIYSFRGACIDNILNFHKWDQFKDCKISNYYLTTNFRSGKNIIEATGGVISENKKRFIKKVRPKNKNKRSEVVFLAGNTLEEEAKEILGAIRYLAACGVKLKEMAIISRVKKFDDIIRALETGNIKHELIGKKSFFFEPEILFIVSWLRIVNNIYDEISIIYLLKSPKYKISDRDIFFLQKTGSGPTNKRTHITDGILSSKKSPYLSPQAKKRLDSFISDLKLYIGKSGVLELMELISMVYKRSGLSDHLKSKFGPHYRKKIKNIENLVKIASDFQQNNLESNLDSFIYYLKDVAKTDNDNPENTGFSKENSVKIMSIHAAKGLEFEVVFLTRLWKSDYLGGKQPDGKYALPSGLRRDNDIWRARKEYTSAAKFKKALHEIKTEEERRIFYVACSRAKKALILTYSKYENAAGAGGDKSVPKEVVPFFKELAGGYPHMKILNKNGLDLIRSDLDNINTAALKKTTHISEALGFLSGNSKSTHRAARAVEYDWKGIEKKLGNNIKKIKNIRDDLSSNTDISSEIKKFERNIKSKPGTSISTPFRIRSSFSLTPILDYMECPMLFKLKHIYLIPDNIDYSLAAGEKIHKYIENITSIRFNDPGISMDRILDLAEDEEIKKYLQVYLQSEISEVAGLENIWLEQLFYWKAGPYFITGKIDRVDKKKDGRFRIIDYKASRHIDGKGLEKNHKYRSQLLAYASAVTDIWNIPLKNITASLFYLKNGVSITFDFSNIEIKGFKDRLLAVIKKINKGSFSAEMTSGCKKACSYYGFCNKGK